MRHLPLADPGTADHRSPGRFLWWMARGQWRTLVVAMLFGIVWMGTQAVMPAVIGRAIDAGVAARDLRTLAAYGGLMLVLGLVQAGSGIVRHRYAVTNWLTAAYRTVQLVGRQTTRLGGSLPRQTSTGEVAAMGTSDLEHLGHVMDVLARFAGAIVSFVLVAVILLQTSVTLGLVVLVGVPVLVLLVGPLLAPLQRRSTAQRELTGSLSNTASDIVAGLRVLRGVGGEQVFARRYAAESQRTRRAGVEVARLQSVLDALQVFLPGVFVVVVVWLGARYAVAGELTAGELVAFYGYAAFLVLPLRTATEFVNRLIRARVSAQCVIAFLALDPEHTDPTGTRPEPPVGSDLADAVSGLHVHGGSIVALVGERPDETAALAERLGLTTPARDAAVTLGGVPLTALPLEVVRRRVVVSDTGAALFSGRLRDVLDVTGTGDVEAALATASAQDVVEALPDGLDHVVTERGRSFSGGQRQRLVLARVLALDPEVLVLVEPTSAVDAHTEAAIARRLREHRRGRTTVVTTSSPLLLDAVDEVAYVRDGRVVATGRHRDLLASVTDYRLTVTREDLEEVAPR
ncbi:ABC transporter transmembrane domain-containing protein [Nocardioides aurantiacus]|uniref:ABC-type multidrug transport system fused ATPase/permease subunit n=1 Tax=Nocardioides aurantiacus TaxID=86796 RepID=A0A3N2CPA2_9ACTN|nr:ABC transporter ATP-binding protein [Nocardioides aurantiacus]ROR89350.1 ABC-type multidrug transport system fused ATPase/permease subunit [Nocardioides aurantiacus]